MNTQFERKPIFTSVEWYTPGWILKNLGKFDLDPCASIVRPFDIAKINYTMEDDGLSLPWFGRVWLNPPYSNVQPFIQRMAIHGRGIALLYNRQDMLWWSQWNWNCAISIRILSGRIRFIKSDGSVSGRPGCGSVLIAYDQESSAILNNSKLPGKWFKLGKTRPRNSLVPCAA
ncbi:MAG: adenine methyltransferase [Candidatus Riflebacteria bacterium]|nr:adenine methyltransferase [Candidatus Riflebacteria bacterium]